MIDWNERIASAARHVEALRSGRMRTFILPGYEMETTSIFLAQAEATLAAYVRARGRDHCIGSAMRPREPLTASVPSLGSGGG